MSQYIAPTLTIEAENGTAYAYRRFGTVGHPVVFLQHFRGNLDNWDPALVDDIAAEREVILVDNSGVGRSTGAHAYKDVQGADDIYYLLFAPSGTSQVLGKQFVDRIFTREIDRDATPALAVRDAQAEAISDWGIPDLSKLARLAGIAQPILVANGDNDIMVPTVNSNLLAGHLPDAELIIYPDAGDGFLFQYPHEFAAEVNRFLTVE
jgi:pimeloyl-ACP methyl ester carboxylesterase